MTAALARTRLDTEALPTARRSRAVHVAGHLTLAAVLGYRIPDIALADWQGACRLRVGELPSLLRAAFHLAGLAAELLLGEGGTDFPGVLSRYRMDIGPAPGADDEDDEDKEWGDVALALWRLEGVPQVRRGVGVKPDEPIERIVAGGCLAIGDEPFRAAVIDLAGWLEVRGRMTAQETERRLLTAAGGIDWLEACAELRGQLAVAALHALKSDPQ